MFTMWKKNGFRPPRFGGGAEGVLVQERGAGCHHHPVQFVLFDVLLDQFLARIRAHVLVVARQDHPRQRPHILGHIGAVHHARNVVSAMADVKADPDTVVALACLFHLWILLSDYHAGCLHLAA